MAKDFGEEESSRPSLNNGRKEMCRILGVDPSLMTPWATVKDLFPFRNIQAVVLNLRVANPLGIRYPAHQIFPL